MKAKDTFGSILFDIANFILMLLIFILMLYPFLYIVNFSLSDPAKIKTGLLLLPAGFTLDSYIACLSRQDVLRGLFISVSRSTVGPFCTILITSMAAFSLSRDYLPGARFFNKYFIFTLYFSGGLIPVYMLMKSLNLTGSFLVYILPLISNAFYFILIRTYIESISVSLEEAALIDGANYIQVFFKVILPVCTPVLAAVVLFACVIHWNSFIDNQLYNSMNRKLFTMQYVLYNYLYSTQASSVEQAQRIASSLSTDTESIRMAITIITIVPILTVYPALQKYFVSGLLIGSVKG